MKTFLPRATFSLIVLAFLFTAVGSPPAQAQSDKITFAVIGDYGLAGQNEADVANLVKSWNPDFVVTTGDNNYPDGAPSTIDQNIGQYYHDYIYPYNGKYGNGASARRFFPSLGNHDWGVNSGRAYFDYFGFRNQQSYYDFVQGPVHFFILNSNREEPDGASSTSTQVKWLKKNLAASTSAFNIVVFHHPPYSSGRHGSNAYMQWPFKEWGADAVLSGHEHTYERLFVNGLPYFVNGLGGAELYYFNAALPESQVRFNQDFGAMRVEATSTTIKFQAITRTGLLIDEYTIGQSNPTVTAITLTSPSPTNANSLNFQVAFSEAVTGLDVSDFLLSSNLNGAMIGNVSGTGATYIVSVNSGSGDGSLRLDLTDNDSITNGMGNSLGGLGLGNGNFTNGETYTLDKTAPAIISIARASENPTHETSVDFSVTFSESVTGVDLSDFGLLTNTGASLYNLTGFGNSYLLSAATGSGNDTLRLNFLDNDTVTDLAGNSTNEGFFNGEAYTVNRSIPFVTSILRASPNPTNAASVNFIVTFSESVDGVDATDFIVNGDVNAFILNLNNANPFYVVTVNAGSNEGALKLDLLDDDSIRNMLGVSLGGEGIGNANYTNGETFSVDRTPPQVTSITRAGSNPSINPSVDFIVTFSEPVLGVDGSDFLAATTNLNSFVTNLQNADPFYVVSVNSGAGSGTIRLDLIDNLSITDLAGNNLNNGAGSGNFITGESFSIAKIPVNFPAPNLLNLSRNSLLNNPTPAFSWSAVRGAMAHELFLALDANFTQIVFSQTLDTTDFTPSSPLADGTYYLRARAYNADLNPGKFSRTYSFTIDTTPPPPPTPVSPPNQSNSPNRPSLQWKAVESGTQYQIELDNNPDFSSPEFASSTPKNSIRTKYLSKGAAYYWRVRAKDKAGNWGGWSESFMFVVP